MMEITKEHWNELKIHTLKMIKYAGQCGLIEEKEKLEAIIKRVEKRNSLSNKI